MENLGSAIMWMIRAAVVVTILAVAAGVAVLVAMNVPWWGLAIFGAAGACLTVGVFVAAVLMFAPKF